MNSWARRNSLPLAVLAAVVCDGCVRSPDLLEPASEVVGVAAIVVAGRSDVIMLVSHPHRSKSSPPPDIAPRLIGPGWEAAFSEVLDLEDDCLIAEPEVWPGSVICLRAALPEPIRAGARYMIAGTGPAGPISGEVIVPAMPQMFEPTQGQRLTASTEGKELPVRIRFELGRDVAMLQAEVIEAVVILSDGSEVPLEGEVWVSPFLLDLEAGVDEILLRRTYGLPLSLSRPVRLSLRLLAFEHNYANFVEVAGKHPLRQPYPSFGLEGAFGYFGAAAPSEPVRVIVEPVE